MDSFEGKRLNAPNDVVVHPDGAIWFTDPGYGILMNYEGHKAEFELPTCVYRLNPATGEATVATADLEKPKRPSVLTRLHPALYRRYRGQPQTGPPSSYLGVRCGGSLPSH